MYSEKHCFRIFSTSFILKNDINREYLSCIIGKTKVSEQKTSDGKL